MERSFAPLTQEQLRRGVHRSVAELEAAVPGYTARHNESPKPFIWTKTADPIPVASRDSVYGLCGGNISGLSCSSIRIHNDIGPLRSHIVAGQHG